MKPWIIVAGVAIAGIGAAAAVSGMRNGNQRNQTRERRKRDKTANDDTPMYAGGSPNFDMTGGVPHHLGTLQSRSGENYVNGFVVSKPLSM
jgi:hypothetical protein